MKRLVTRFSILLMVFLSSSCKTLDGYPESAEEWLFVHTADEAQIPNTTTIVMSLAWGDIFAFKYTRNRNLDYITGAKFASMWADTDHDSFKITPPNALLTWVDDGNLKEAEVVITDASSDENTITYTIQAMGLPFSQVPLTMVSIYIFEARASYNGSEPDSEPEIMSSKGCPTNCPSGY